MGTTVTVRDEETGEEFPFAIVGAEEADPWQDKISNESPVGMALMGAVKGQTVTVEVPMGTVKYTVLDINR